MYHVLKSDIFFTLYHFVRVTHALQLTPMKRSRVTHVTRVTALK